MHEKTMDLIGSYYAAFNQQDTSAMLALLADDVIHEPCQGQVRVGKAAFLQFLSDMNRCYAEQVLDPVIFANPEGTRAAAEFQLSGRYIATDGELPEASGQTYLLRVGAFFEVRGTSIIRVTNHYNLAEWISQVRRTDG